MIPDTGSTVAGFEDGSKYRVIAWNDRGYAMIANNRGKLERACNVQGFTGLEKIRLPD